MSENRYPCPECGAVLRPKNAVAPGKKIRCPKCEAVFAPTAEDEDEPAPVRRSAPKKKTAVTAAPAPKPKPKPKAKSSGDDDEDGGNYSFAAEDDEPKKRAVEYGSLRDKFAKSARGPAMAKLTVPGNWMMFFGIIGCLGYLVWFCVGWWPLVFTKDPITGPILFVAIIIMFFAALGFVLNALVVVGMFKMVSLESLGWAWTGAILGVLFSFWPVAIWVIITLNDPVVKAGFAAKKPEYDS